MIRMRLRRNQRSGYLCVALAALLAAQSVMAQKPHLPGIKGQDKAHILSRHEGCRITGAMVQGRLVLHDCDATHGDSGSPLLVREG